MKNEMKPLDLTLAEAVESYLKTHEMAAETPWQQKLRARIGELLKKG